MPRILFAKKSPRLSENNDKYHSPHHPFQSSTSSFPIRHHPSPSPSYYNYNSIQNQELPVVRRKMRFPFSEEGPPNPNPNRNPLSFSHMQIRNQNNPPFQNSGNNNNKKYPQYNRNGLGGTAELISSHRRHTAELAAAAAVAASPFPYQYDRPDLVKKQRYIQKKPLHVQPYESNFNRFQNFKDADDLPRPRPHPFMNMNMNLPDEFKRGQQIKNTNVLSLNKLSPLDSPHNYKNLYKNQLPTHGYLIYNTLKGPPFHFVPAPKPDVENFHGQYFNIGK
jgi:hypothetical protein